MDEAFVVITVIGDDYCGQNCPQYDQRGQGNVVCQECESIPKTRPDEYK